MIIDSHAHYALKGYDGTFSCLACAGEHGFTQHTDRKRLLATMRTGGICGFIEPSIDPADACLEKQKVIAEEFGGWVALGVHPKAAANAGPEVYERLRMRAGDRRVVAIGETGLDYHRPSLYEQRESQMRWFFLLIRLAHRLKLPLILHIRDAYADALSILEQERRHLHGGVAHCFSGGPDMAQAYISLGFGLGIGGRLLADDQRARDLRETVRTVPLSSILVETDAPYVLPPMDGLTISKHQKSKLLNSSLILPDVIAEIAHLRGIEKQEAEKAIFMNTVRTFRLKG